MKVTKDVEKLILLYLSNNTSPQGAGSVCNFLRDNGILLGEATVGRVLRLLDEKGYLEKNGFKGRHLSQKGKLHLKNLLVLQDKKESLRDFGQFFFTEEGDYLRDILVARRALEGEAAALAALNATEEDLKEIEKSIVEMEDLLRLKKSMAATDILFHSAIAKASKNKIIETAMQVIRHGGQDSSVVEKLRNRAGSSIGSDHKKIFQAIKNGDCDRARCLMTEHLNNIIKDLDYVERQSE